MSRRDAGRAAAVLAPLVTLLALALLLHRPEPSTADDGVWRTIAHGDPDTGAQHKYTPNMTGDATDTGICANCHVEHASWNAGAGTINSGNGRDDLTFDVQDLGVTAVCYDCHTNAYGPSGKLWHWRGRTDYNASSHGSTATGAIWDANAGGNPPARGGGDRGFCVNCHNPHGRRVSAADNVTGGPYSITSADGVFNLLVRQEENLCLACHDANGTAGTQDDIKTLLDLQTSSSPTFFEHPIGEGITNASPSYHLTSETAASFTTTTRHVECQDCHNVHKLTTGNSVKGDSRAGAVLRGAWGVMQASWPNGEASGSGNLQAAPTFVRQEITDTVPEYALCMRCHSSYSTLPTFASPNDVTDISREINPNNAAHHAIAGPGNLQSLNLQDTRAFVNGWTSDSWVVCSDCHTYEPSTRADGPHGSNNPWILDTYETSAVGLTAEQSVLCFNCHNYNVYHDGAAGISRVNHPMSTMGNHGNNSDNAFGIWCMSCHGGAVEGGIHGTNAGPGSSGFGTANLGDHFMNGAAIIGFTHDDGSGHISCWSTTGKTTYDLNCAHSHKGVNDNFNFQY